MFQAIRSQLERSVPFHQVIGLVLDQVDSHGARARVPEQAALTNHVGTLHAGVVFSACESASGAALVGALLPVIMRTRFVVRDARISYLKPARGELITHAALADDPAALIAALERDGRVQVVVDASGRTQAGTADERVVAKASFDWVLTWIDG